MKIRNFIKNDINKLKLFNINSFFASINIKNFSTSFFNNFDKYSSYSYLNEICDNDFNESNDKNSKHSEMQKNFLNYNLDFDYIRLNDKIFNQEKFNENESNHLTNFKLKEEINLIQGFNKNNNEMNNIAIMSVKKNEGENILNLPEFEMLGKKKKMAKKKRAKRKYDRDINVRYR